MEKKNLIITGILMLVFCSAPCGAQETSDTITCSPEADKEILISRIRSTRQDEDATSHAAYPIPEDYVTSMPWTGWGMGGWDLHEGLNAQVGAGVRVGWGKNNPWRGASFFTDLAAMYCLPLSKDGRWSAAVGGYFSNYRLWGRQVNSVGICGLVNYRFNEKYDLSGFVMHDFGVIGGHAAGSPLMPFLEQPHTTVGAQFGINVSEKARVEIGLSFTRQSNPFPSCYLPAGRPLITQPTRSLSDPDF